MLRLYYTKKLNIALTIMIKGVIVMVIAELVRDRITHSNTLRDTIVVSQKLNIDKSLIQVKV